METEHTMEIAPIAPTKTTAEGWHYWRLDAVRERLGDAYNGVAAAKEGGADAAEQLTAARTAMDAAAVEIEQMLGHDGPDDAIQAATTLQPRVTRAITDLTRIGVTPKPDDVQALLTECGDALDHVEQVLGAIGWD
jgi:hypothetical protein